MTKQSWQHPVRVLLTEDNPADVYLIREALKEELPDFELEVLVNGEAASKLVERFTDQSREWPDIILLDLNLPRCDGKEVLEKLKQTPGAQRVPVIIITSSDSPKDREDCVRLGASWYFRKPSDLTEFMKIAGVVKALLERARNASGTSSNA